MKLSVSLQNIMPADTVEVVDHPDGGDLKGLQRGDGKYLSLEANGEKWTTRWVDNLGAWEAFLVGAHITAIRDGGTYILPIGGKW